MKRIKEVKAECMYLFQGRSSAKCEIVSNLQEAKEFIKSANIRFEGFMKIRSYSIAQDTWTMIVELEDEKTIISNYLELRNRSRRAKSGCSHEEVWRMISECLRHWLSRFVKWRNFRSKREGTLRMRSYERFFFESVEEAEAYVNRMLEQKIGIRQKSNRFRPSSKKWVLRKVGLGHIYLCVKHVTREKVLAIFGAGALEIIGFSSDVLRKLTKETFKAHFSSFSTIQVKKIE